MNKAEIGAHICWHVEGTLNQVEEGIVVALFEWPLTGGIQAYVVEPGNPAVIASIVPANSVIKRITQGAQ